MPATFYSFATFPDVACSPAKQNREYELVKITKTMLLLEDQEWVNDFYHAETLIDLNRPLTAADFIYQIII
jgi:hypothetical protein